MPYVRPDVGAVRRPERRMPRASVTAMPTDDDQPEVVTLSVPRTPEAEAFQAEVSRGFGELQVLRQLATEQEAKLADQRRHLSDLISQLEMVRQQRDAFKVIVE